MPDSQTPYVFGYNAEATDYSTGMQYLRARYYDTKAQRFVEEDDYRGSFSEPQTMNRYIYVGNEPINRIDPSGYGWLKNTWNTVKSAASQAVSAISNAVKSLVTVKNTVTDTIKNISSKIVGKDSKLNQIENITNNSFGDSNQIEDTKNDEDTYGISNGNYPNNRVPNPNTGDNDDGYECTENINDTELLNELSAQVREDLSWLERNKNLGLYSDEKALKKILEYDDIITDTSAKYGLEKEMVQSILFRELRFYDVRDIFADSAVRQTGAYLNMIEEQNPLLYWAEPPLLWKEDSSTGLGQVTTRTAIKAINYANEEGIIDWGPYDYENVSERYEIWEKLNGDAEFNIELVSLVLVWSAADVGIHNNYGEYTEEELKSLFARYNGISDATIEYGDEVYNTYEIFSKYNDSEE